MVGASFSRRRWSVPGILAVLATTLTWALFELVNIDTLANLMLPVAMWAIAWALLGFTGARRMIPYLLLLSLSLPFWSDLTGPLVSIASVAVGNFVSLLGMTALIEGSSITLPYGRLIIADGCSGIRYFAISILLAATVSILNDYRWRGWILAIGLAMALGVLSNWIRITGLVIIGYQSEMQSSLMQDHELYGWVIYALICLPALYLAPVNHRSSNLSQTRFTVNPTGFVAIALAFLAGPLLVLLYQGSIEAKPGWAVTSTEAQSSNGRGAPLALAIPDTMATRHYWFPEDDVWLNLAQFQRQSSKQKLVPYIPNTIDTDDWQHQREISEVDGTTINIYRNVITQRRVAQAQWYKVGPFDTRDYRMAKLLQIPSTFLNDNRFALITMQRVCQTMSCERELGLLANAASSLTLEPIKP